MLKTGHINHSGQIPRLLILAAMLLLPWLSSLPAIAREPDQAKVDAAALFARHCAQCHGKDRLGGTGPALLPQNLHRLRRERALATIANGRPATQMPAFGAILNPLQMEALAAYIFTPLPHMPVWGRQEIEKSRVLIPEKTMTSKPLWKGDPLNLFVVVESGDHHVSILDGDSFERLARFKSRFALHGGPKFTSDGRYVFFGSRDGWITKYDLYTLQVTAEVRAGINMRNIAVSSDNRYVIAANYLPHTLVLFRASDLSLIKIIPVRDGHNSSRVSAVYDAAPRHSFIAALKDIRELWEITYGGDDNSLSIRRIRLDDYLDDFFFTQDYHYLIGAARGEKGSHNGQVIDLDSGRKIAGLALPGMPHLGSGIKFTWRGRRVMATPNLRENAISVIDLTNWKLIKKIPTDGPGFFIRSHENTPYAWAGPFFGPHRDEMHIIGKRSLEIVKTLRPFPGHTLAHAEFDRYGRHVLLSLWERKGAVLVYDARTFKLLKRIPMSRPAGKYNVFNKTRRSEGTSH